MSEIEKIKSLAKSHKIQFTDHASKRMSERSIDILDDVLPALQTGQIIEEYPDDFPYKSFLVLGTTLLNIPLHIVCAISENVLWIITVYFPDNNKWEDNFKKRKEQK